MARIKICENNYYARFPIANRYLFPVLKYSFRHPVFEQVSIYFCFRGLGTLITNTVILT